MEKTCAQCGQTKPAELFYRSKRNSDGRDSYCKDCRDGKVRGRSARLRAARPPKETPTEKECTRCGETKPLSEFFSAGKGRKASWCKACKVEYHAEYVARPEVAAKLKEQDRNRREGNWKRPPRREPVGPGFEVCTSCNEDKPVSGFHRHKLGRNGCDSVCKDCKRVLHQERRKDPAFLEKERDWKLGREYGFTPGQYEEMLAAQNGVCAICGQAKRNGRRLHVDHCHTTGAIRGLLCYSCNALLGLAGDSVEVLRAAITYLERSSPDAH